MKQEIAALITDQTFPKTSRLLKPSEFQVVYKSGEWVTNRELVINFTRQDSPISRLGITVSKKVSKRAVDRNRIKRHIREWFRKKQNTKESLDIVLTAKPSIKMKAAIEIHQSLEDIWRKVQKKL